MGNLQPSSNHDSNTVLEASHHHCSVKKCGGAAAGDIFSLSKQGEANEFKNKHLLTLILLTFLPHVPHEF